MATYDFSSLLQKIFEKNPDMIYMASFSEGALKAISDINLGGYISGDNGPTIFYADGTNADSLKTTGYKEVIEDSYGIHPTIPKESENFKRFADNFKARFEHDSIDYAPHIYDAIYITAYAISKANSIEPEEIKKHLKAVSRSDNGDTEIDVNEFSKGVEELKKGNDINYDGASGTIEFDDNGDPESGTYLIWKLSGSDLTYSEEKEITYPTETK